MRAGGTCPSPKSAKVTRLKRRGATGRSIARASAPSSKSVPGTSVLNIGLIGVGRIGRLHAANLAHQISRARLVAIAGVIEEAARQRPPENGDSVPVGAYRH